MLFYIYIDGARVIVFRNLCTQAKFMEHCVNYMRIIGMFAGKLFVVVLILFHGSP